MRHHHFHRHAERYHRFRLWHGPRRSLQRRLFVWFAATMAITGLVVGIVFGSLGPGPGMPHRPHHFGVLFVALAAAGSTLWIAAAWISHRLTRPLVELARVTSEIGAGRWNARVRLSRRHPGEIGVLADAVNDMAGRIEKQLRDQRELLAAVSHEIRSPLARLRLLAELARNATDREHVITEFEREITEIDELVGKLLASSRLDFEALTPKPIHAKDAALRALEVAGLSSDLFEDQGSETIIEADPTLLGRALANLIENAKTHGKGVRALKVHEEPGAGFTVFEVTDFGPGFAPADLGKVFEAFYRSGGRGHGALGLGLSLVERIARAHGGNAFARNAGDSGAVVGIRLPFKKPASL